MWKSACSFTANNSRKFFPLKTACDSVPMSFVKAQHGAVHLFTFYGACSLKYLAEWLPSSSNPFTSTTVSESLNQSAVPQDRADQPVLMKVILKTPLLCCQCELHYKHCSSVMLIPEEAAWNLPPPEHTSIYSLCMNLTFAFRLQIAKQRMCKVLELRTKHFDLLFYLNLLLCPQKSTHSEYSPQIPISFLTSNKHLKMSNWASSTEQRKSNPILQICFRLLTAHLQKLTCRGQRKKWAKVQRAEIW